MYKLITAYYCSDSAFDNQIASSTSREKANLDLFGLDRELWWAGGVPHEVANVAQVK
jgi:hypothetical protein